MLCENFHARGVTQDGGFAEYVTLRTEAVIHVPKVMDPADAAPLLCAGMTCYSMCPV